MDARKKHCIKTYAFSAAYFLCWAIGLGLEVIR